MSPRAGWQYDSPAVLHSDLDDAGLTVQQFRVMLHVCRRHGDGSNGIGCTSKVDTMAEVCRLHPDSVRKILKSLVALGWLHRNERSGATTVYVPRFPNPSACKGGVEDQGRGVKRMEGLNFDGGGASGFEGGEGLRIKGDEGIQLREPNKGTK